MAKQRTRSTLDASGERLVELGFSYTATGWYAAALQLRCFRHPVTASLDAGRSGIHPAQLEAVERLFAERTYALNDMAVAAAYDATAEWYRRYAPGERCPSKRWVRENARVGEVYVPAPGRAVRGTVPAQFGVFASRSREDDDSVHVYFIWTGEGWLGSRD